MQQRENVSAAVLNLLQCVVERGILFNKSNEIGA